MISDRSSGTEDCLKTEVLALLAAECLVLPSQELMAFKNILLQYIEYITILLFFLLAVNETYLKKN